MNVSNSEPYIQLEGLTPYQNMLYKFYIQKAQEATDPVEMATYNQEIENLREKAGIVPEAKDLSSFLTA